MLKLMGKKIFTILRCLFCFCKPVELSLTLCIPVTPMCTFANSEHPDEMLHNAAFHQSNDCLPRQKLSSELFGSYNLCPFHIYNGQS